MLEAFLAFPDLEYKSLAEALGISCKTLEIHVSQIRKKTGYRTMQGVLVELLKDLYAESLAREADGDR